MGFETYGTVAASKGGYASVGDEADGTRNPLLNPSNFRAPPAFPAPPVPQSSASAPATTPSTGSATASTAASGKVSSSSKPSKPPPGAKPKGVTIAAEPSRREVDTASYSPLSIEGDLLDMDLDLHSADETPVSTSAKPTSESAFTGFDA